MNIDELTIKQVKELTALIKGGETGQMESGLIGKYVIVRCRDAGVHAGVLESHNGRECVLLESRRLWYWKPAKNKCFLSGVAVAGLHNNSKVGAPISRMLLTENCEIIECSEEAKTSISGSPEYEK